MPSLALEGRRKKFVAEYIRGGFNGTRAAIAAGYSSNGANVTAIRLLADPTVMQQVRDLADQHFEPVLMGAKETLARASIVARADFADLLDEDGNLRPLRDVDPEVRRAIESVKTDVWLGKDADLGLATRTVKFASKTAALQLLAKYHGLVRDREPETPPPVQRAMGEVELARSIAFALMRADAETVEPT